MKTSFFVRLGLGLALISVGVLVVGASHAARSGELTAAQARNLIAKMPGFALSRDAVRVREVTSVGTSAVVVAQVETAFRLEKGATGDWRVAEIRTGSDHWQSVDELARSLTDEKLSVAKSEMETIATALESYRRSRGGYVSGETTAVLMDHLQPQFICRVIRVDPWQHPYAYSGNAEGYSLRSAGPDGALNTADDVIFR